MQREIQSDLFTARTSGGDGLSPLAEGLESDVDDFEDLQPCLLPAEGEDGMMEWVCK